MDINYKDLASLLGVSKDKTRQILSRAEFAHIPLRYGIYYGVTKKDVEKIMERVR